MKVEEFFKDRTIAAVLVRSYIRQSPDVRKTLEMLRLTKTNSVGLFKKNATTLGMLNRVKDFITYGDVDKEIVDMLISKKNPVKRNNKGEEYISHVFNLNPPKGGFERKGIKKPFTVGGVLGKRTNIKELIKKMLQ